MTDLFWPGDERAGAVFSPAGLLEDLVAVEQAWLDALVAAGVAPETAGVDLTGLVGAGDVDRVARGAESSGNPVVPLLAVLRERLTARDGTDAPPARWLHRGLTSQDVLDTALVLGARRTSTQLLTELDAQVTALVRLADRHRGALTAGRTLTQHAVPITFGLKAARWLQGVLDARDGVRRLRFPVQVGGAAGTLSAATLLAGDPDAAEFLVAETARTLGLEQVPSWHTSRSPLTSYADALVQVTDALGHVANDVLLLARPEIAELAEPAVAGRGGSSTMPQKANPVLSVLLRRAALTNPGLAAQLHLAAAGAVDERPDGAWHTEWSTLATVSRHTLTAASQATELVSGLHVDTGRMAALVRSQSSSLLAEQRSVSGLLEDGREPDFDPAHYLGATEAMIDRILERAQEDA